MGLTGTIPTTIGSMTNLVNLELDTNKLTASIPSELGLLHKLRLLFLFDYQLSARIPSELGDMSSLEFLLLDDNNLSGTTPVLESSGWLMEVTVQDNQLSGTIPAGLCQVPTISFDCDDQLCGCGDDVCPCQETEEDLGPVPNTVPIVPSAEPDSFVTEQTIDLSKPWW